MAEPFLAEIRVFPYNFTPRGWADCNGQLLPIAQNTALFSLLGTTYGGDGRTTMGLPNLQGRLQMGRGNGAGLTPRNLGSSGGADTAIVTHAAHGHSLHAISDPADFQGPGPARALARSTGGAVYAAAGAPTAALAAEAVETVGGGQAHTNLQPYLALRVCIATVGLYPSRS